MPDGAMMSPMARDATAPAGATPTLVDRFRDPLADPVRDRSRLRFAAGLVVIGILHFVAPRPFERIVPRWFPWAKGAVFWSGVAEVGSGALLAVPRTQRLGGALAAATIVAVYPANIQMAVDAARGRSSVPGPAWISWARLPLQVPMVATALRFARGT